MKNGSGWTVAVVALSLLALPAWSSAQGLGALAAREKAKRAAGAAKPEAKTFDNADLDKGRPPGAPASGAAGAPAGDPGPAAAPEPAPEPDRNATEKPLLDGISAAQERIAAVEQRIRELSDKLNPMSVTYIYGSAHVGDATAEEARTRQELSDAQGDLAQARQALVEAQEALREFRRRGGSTVDEAL